MTVRRATWRLCGAGILALSFLVVALHLYLNSALARGWILSHVRTSLAARFGELELGDRFEVDWLGRVTAGPLTIRDEQGPILTVSFLRLRMAYRLLLQGRLEPAAISLDKIEIDVDRAKSAFDRLIETRRAKPFELGQSEQRLRDISVRANEIQMRTARPWLQRLFGILDPLSGKLVIHQSNADWLIRGNLQFSRDGESSLGVQLRRDGTLQLSLNSNVDHLDGLFDQHEDWPFAAKGGELAVTIDVDSERDLRRGTASCVIKMHKLQLEGERLDSQTVGPLDVSGAASVNWDSAADQIHLTKTELALSDYGPLPLIITGGLRLGRERHLDIEASLHKLDFPKLLRALPPQLSPGSEIPTMSGVVSAQFELNGPLFQPAQMELAAKLDLTGLHASPSSSVPLMNSFEYRPLAEQVQAPAITVGEKNPDFVPLAAIPPFLVGAVTLSEDAGFWGHRGFDFQEIKDSLVDAAEEKRFRGASTITQQLAKNLYFSREKTYARKIREAIATLILEATLPKSRILEIYLNIIEWGPGIHGVAQAAQHYFGRDVRELTPKQAAFLATIIPNPIKYYVYYRQGALSEVWEKRVHDLLVKMRDRGVVNEEEFAQAEETPIAFASSKDTEN